MLILENQAAMQDLIACPDCGQLHHYQTLDKGKEAICQRCGTILYHTRDQNQDTVLAITVAALVLYVFSNILPLLGLRFQGNEIEMHLAGASAAFWQQGYPIIAVLIVLNIIIFPLFELSAILIVLLIIRFNWPKNLAIRIYRWMRELKPWGMLEVFMLSLLVAIVKLGDMASPILGGAFWSFIGLIILMAAANSLLDPMWVWQALGGKCPISAHTDPQSLVQCPVCHCLQVQNEQGRCQRCQTNIKPKDAARSVEIAFALVIAAAILYIPANLMPVMSFYFLHDGQPDTILSGVFRLIANGQWPLALIVFIASIVVPLLKLITLSFLLFTIHRKSSWRPRDRMWLYKVTEYIGRWSMVDIFVIAILVGLVQFGNVARVEANVGTFSFAAVVVLTMFAARALDSHLIWDSSHTARSVHGR